MQEWITGKTAHALLLPSSQTPRPASPHGGSHRWGSPWRRQPWRSWRPWSCPELCPASRPGGCHHKPPQRQHNPLTYQCYSTKVMVPLSPGARALPSAWWPGAACPSRSQKPPRHGADRQRTGGCSRTLPLSSHNWVPFPEPGPPEEEEQEALVLVINCGAAKKKTESKLMSCVLTHNKDDLGIFNFVWKEHVQKRLSQNLWTKPGSVSTWGKFILNQTLSMVRCRISGAGIPHVCLCYSAGLCYSSNSVAMATVVT